MATKKARKAGPKPRPKTKARTKTAKPARPALECGVCGYRVIIDEECGCAEEHVLVCCGQPMTRK